MLPSRVLQLPPAFSLEAGPPVVPKAKCFSGPVGPVGGTVACVLGQAH